MYIDTNLEFSDAQSVTATAISTNVYDTLSIAAGGGSVGINGGTTQLRGVTPDIVFPGIFDEQSVGESSFDNALPWVQIRPATYAAAGDLKGLMPLLRLLHETRSKADKDYVMLLEDIAEGRSQRAKNMVSLNESVRRTEQTLRDARLASRQGNRDDGLQPNERNIVAQLAAEKAMEP